MDLHPDITLPYLTLPDQACKCDKEQLDSDKLGHHDQGRRAATTDHQSRKRSRGFTDELDPNAQGMHETYTRKCAQIDLRYPEMSAKDIVKKLLGRAADVMENDSDDEADAASSSNSIGVTGEQGGRLLACFLVRAEQDNSVPFLANGILAFLHKQVPKVVLYPAAKLCIEKAIKFIPKLKAGLANHVADGAMNGPEIDFGDTDVDDN